MNKVLLYDKTSTSSATLTIMKCKGYCCKALTEDPVFFWNSISELKINSILVLFSHGDENGPSAVEGTEGGTIDVERFSNTLKERNVKLYLISCNTGSGNCGSALQKAKIDFVAPTGKAELQTIGSETINVFSRNPKKGSHAWIGSLSPKRATHALSLP